MTSIGARGEFRAGPVYFFDQPTARDQSKGTRVNVLHFNLAKEGARLAEIVKSSPEKRLASCLNKYHKGEEKYSEKNPPEAFGMNKHDALLTVNSEQNVCQGNPQVIPDDDGVVNPMDAYKAAAPVLLDELACLLWQYKWNEEGCIPHGLVNILHCSWQDLTSGAFGVKSQVGECAEHRRSHCPEIAEKTQKVIVNETRKPEKKVSPNISFKRKMKTRPKKTSPPNTQRDIANGSATISFSISSKLCKEQGWIIQPKEMSCDEPQKTTVCQWVLQRLRAARIPIQLQATKESEGGLDKPPITRHYGSTKSCFKNKRTGEKSCPTTLVNGMPPIPGVIPTDPSKRKLHYGINDGSSIVYYPSGSVAICQSSSGLACGGFYTNVFSDGESAVLLVSVTAFGHGAVTHPVSRTVTAVWDQDGGLMCDPDGTVTKRWTWQSGSGPKERVVVMQVSDLISIKLLNSTCGLLSFRSQGESVQLPLSTLSHLTLQRDTSCLKTSGRFTSRTARDLLLREKRKLPGHAVVSVIPSVNSVPVCYPEVLQMAKEVDGLEEPVVQWGGSKRAELGRELSRLQRRARIILEDWLACYRMATGVRCPDIERMPDAPLRTRHKREVHSAGLPSLNPPVWADAQPDHLKEPPRHLSAPVDYLLCSSGERPRSVIIPQIPACQHSSVDVYQVVHPSSSSSFSSPPSRQCPAQLRASVCGAEAEESPPCHCSSRLMPVVTDLEYDAFVAGQGAGSEQVLVVCVTAPRQPLGACETGSSQDMLEQLYERRNRNRTMPCIQCQMEPFRLVRYEVSTRKTSSAPNTLLQLRHNVAPGMVLMYIRGKLLFADYIFNGYSRSIRDLQKQITRTSRDHNMGLSLPSDYKFSAKLKSSENR